MKKKEVAKNGHTRNKKNKIKTANCIQMTDDIYFVGGFG